MVEVTPYYGIIIKLDSLARIGLSIPQFCKETEATLLVSDEKIASFDPCFGKEAGDATSQKIEKLSLECVEDYFTFDLDLPEWIGLQAFLK